MNTDWITIPDPIPARFAQSKIMLSADELELASVFGLQRLLDIAGYDRTEGGTPPGRHLLEQSQARIVQSVAEYCFSQSAGAKWKPSHTPATHQPIPGVNVRGSSNPLSKVIIPEQQFDKALDYVLVTPEDINDPFEWRVKGFIQGSKLAISSPIEIRSGMPLCFIAQQSELTLIKERSAVKLGLKAPPEPTENPVTEKSPPTEKPDPEPEPAVDDVSW